MICSERAAEIKIGGDGERGVKGKGKGVLRPKRNSRFGQNYIKSCMHGSGWVPRTRTLAIARVGGAQGGGHRSRLVLCKRRGWRDQSGARWSRSRRRSVWKGFRCYTRVPSADLGRVGLLM